MLNDEIVLNLIRTELTLDDSVSLGPTTESADVAGWDSLGQMLVVVALEREFGVEIPASDIPQLTSAAKIHVYLRGKGVN